MTPQELDNALEEVSHRLERVRSLYEQYFMGIERTMPSIPKKDLDRRIDALRRTKFNNTAKRFKFQTLVQRYTSLQQYWHRTCREIENGTYRKHLRKAERRFAEADEASQNLDQAGPSEAAARGRQTREEMESELVALLDSKVDFDAEMGNVLSELERRPARAAAQAPKRTLLESLGKAGGTSSQKERDPLPLPRSHNSPRPTLDPLPALQKSRAVRTSPLAAPLSPSAASEPRLPAAPLSPSAASEPRLPAASPSPENPPAAPPHVAAAARTPPGPPPPRRAAPSPRATTTAATESLSDERIRAIHAKYQAARSETKATAVSYEKLQRSIRETERELRARNQGKNVDFDVSIKNGKAILTPRLK